MRKIELLSPAGDLERLKTAIRYGADAVYIGGKQFSLRARASNFEIEDIAEGVQFANEYGAHIHVTVNMLPHEEDLEGLITYLKELERVGVTAIIVAAPYIAMVAKEHAPGLEVHISTQHSTTNSSAANYWKDKGMDRVVLARETTLEEIKATTANTDVPIEVFLHGGMCISYSGRCVLSNNMTGRDANRGGCAQSCRWKYTLYEDGEIISDVEDPFSMSSKDLMGADYIAELIEAGVSSLKIEGRMKSAYYVATLIHTYRNLIDEIYENGGALSEERMAYYRHELAKAENRPTASGFFGGLPSFEAQLFGVNGAGVTQEYIAYVLDYDQENMIAKLQVRNKFDPNIEVEVFGPGMPPKRLMISDLYDKNDERLEVANKPMEVIYTKTEVVLPKDAMIRRIMDKDRSDIY